MQERKIKRIENCSLIAMGSFLNLKIANPPLKKDNLSKPKAIG